MKNVLSLLLLSLSLGVLWSESEAVKHKNAYATMMYVGTPRDYEYYVATRVMLRSLSKLNVQADLVVIASVDVPLRWIHTLEKEDGAKVVRVENVENPYKKQRNFDKRFSKSLNKIYGWRLVEYERVVMLDVDNLFLHNTDELFQCGSFCAVFINPCIFHTGLFVLRPSLRVFHEMVRGIANETSNPDGADQGFIGAFFPDLLDRPLFHPPADPAGVLNDTYRLPLGYQMDASYFYLKLRWSVPCGPNSVITFPGAPWLKPWYWWAWPVLPLGISWHRQRTLTLGYADDVPALAIQTLLYLALIPAAGLAKRASMWKKSVGVRLVTGLCSVLGAYALPFLVVPRTIHPLLGWPLYFLASFALSSVSTHAFLLPRLPVLVPWFGIIGVLFVMAFPWYANGIVRAMSVFGYAFVCAPFIWHSSVKLYHCLRHSHHHTTTLGVSSNKLY